MTLVADLTWFLNQNAALVALVGTRIEYRPMKQGQTLPAVTYWRVSTSRINSQDGRSKLTRSRFQFDCWAETYLESISIGDALVEAFDNWGNQFNGAAFIEERRDHFESNSQIYAQMIDVFIWYKT